MSETIYFVTVFSLPLDERGKSSGDMRWADRPEGWDSVNYRRSRCWGWFRDIDTARRCIMENWTDIYENAYYDLAMIEPMAEGICGCVAGDEWYDVEPQLDAEGCVTGYNIAKIEKPLRLKSLVGFSYS